MRRISILSLTKSTGGIAFYNRMLLAGLDPARFASHTICLSENAQSYAAEMQALGLGAEPVAMARYRLDPAGDLRVFARILAKARETRPDVILCHGSKAGVLGRAAGRIAGIPVVYCQASLPFLKRVQGAKAPAYWGLEFAARSLGGHMVALTEGARRETIAHRLFPADRIEVIHTGVDTETFRPRGRRDAAVAGFGLDPARPVVGWLGRFEPQKAPADHIAAVEIAARAHPAAQFVMAGEGRMKDEVAARIAGAGLTDRVRLLPWQAEPGRTLEGFDIYALSSRWEGLPITLLEAMAAGCAPVSTEVDGCGDVIEQGVSGFLTPPGDPPALGAALGALLGDPALRAAVSAAARQRIVARFERQAMLARWSSLLERVSRPGAAAALLGARA